MKNKAYSSIPIVKRSSKPRDNGLTMVFDYGMGLYQQRDLLDVASDYIDLVKIRVGSSRLYNMSYLKSKIELYKGYEVLTFPGGQFLEYAISIEKTEEYLKETVKLGFEVVEVSDNRIQISFRQKEKLIKTAKSEYGLRVLGEVGSKDKCSSLEEILSDIDNTLKAGAWKVLIEAADLFVEGKFRINIVEGICKRFDTKELIFELPHYRIKGIDKLAIYEMQTILIREFGCNVSLANVDEGEIYVLEGVRRNIDGNMDLELAKKMFKRDPN
jgi:phosphosulfolactate synthase